MNIRNLIKRAGGPVMAVMLVLSLVGAGVAPSPVGTASATHECGTADAIVAFATFTAVNYDKCTNNHVDHAIQDMKEADANQTEVDIYSAGTSSKAAQEAAMAPYDNYLNDTESVAWMKAEKAIAEAYQNGASKAEAKVAAKEAIANYYATKQKNLIEQWNVSVTEWESLHDRAQMEDNISMEREGFVYSKGQYGDQGGYAVFPQYVQKGNPEKTVTLVNGNTSDVETLWFNSQHKSTAYSNGHFNYDYVHVATGDQVIEDGDSSTNPVAQQLAIKPPNSNYETLVVLDYTDYSSRWDSIETMNTNLQSEVDVYVDATWTDYESGTINASDVVSSTTLMFEYGTADTNNSSMYDVTASLAGMGYDTPDLNGTGQMDVTYAGQTYQGLVLAESAPNGSWESGVTYNTSNITGPVMIATVDGQVVDIPDGETFTIAQITDKEGQNVGSVNTTKYVYKTANTSELLEMQQQLTDLRQELEDREPDPAGGGGGSGGTNIPPMAIIVLAGVALGGLFLRGGGLRE